MTVVMSQKRMSEVLSLEYRALLERLGEFEKALTRSSVIRLQEIVRSLEEHLLLHRRREEEALFPAMARHLPGEGGPVHRRRLKGREHGERLKELRSNIQIGHRGKFLYQGQLFVASLRDHLHGGGAQLLPLAVRLLSQEEWDRVRRGFESIRMAAEPVAPESTISA
jgi:hemerythrin-like domain-containing protein